MSDKSDKVLYECECFRVLQYRDDDGNANVSLSLYNHGIDVFLTEEEFSHLVEVLSGLEHFYVKDAVRH